MRELVIIIASGVAGIIIGLTLGYIIGHARGWDQANSWHKRNSAEVYLSQEVDSDY